MVLRERLQFLSSHAGDVGVNAATQARVFDVVLMAPLQNGWTFDVDVLRASAHLFNGATVFCDHNPLGADNAYPSVRDVVGVISDAREEQGELHGTLHVSPGAAWLSALLEFAIELRAQGLTPPDVGMSADISFASDPSTMPIGSAQGVQRVNEILRVWSVDVVFDPAAGGNTILRALNASAPSLAAIDSGGNEFMKTALTKSFWRQTFALDAHSGNGGGAVSTTQTDTPLGDVRKTNEQAQALLRAQCAATLTQVVGALDLPEIHKVILRERFEGKIFDASELTTAVEQQRRVYASHVEKNVIQGIVAPSDTRRGAFVHGMWTDLERFQFAVDRLLGAAIPEGMTDVPRLSGIREAYLLATGDYSFHGQFDGARVQFANATTSTMAGLVAVALNKVVAAKWAELQPVYGWFHKIVVEEDFDSLNTINWVTVGGFGDLPTVPEGAAYTEMVWDDSTEQASWLKKGGYIGLTLEMMDRDQTHKVRAIPTALATSGMRTLSAAVSSILTTNAALADGTALFHSTSALRGGDGVTAASGNLSTTALSATEWDVHIQKTFSKTELNSNRRMGIRPRYVIVPIELEKTALQIFSSGIEPTANAFYDNVRVSGSDNVVVNPEFTDANDWYSAVDPKVYPCLGVGYRFGRRPEIFTAGDQTIGSMFTNDELRIKGRFFFGVGVIDWRGLRRASV